MSFDKAVKQLRASYSKRKKGPSVRPPARKQAAVTAYKTFLNTYSRAVYRAAYADPDGVDEFHPVDMGDASLGRVVRKALMASRIENAKGAL